jgi:hypothetical protein
MLVKSLKFRKSDLAVAHEQIRILNQPGNSKERTFDQYLICDFNQMLELKIRNSEKAHINNFDADYLNTREIITGQHCFGCTAGAGSSCGGSIS